MPLSDDQQIVVDHPDENKLVIALPGSGKTHTSKELAKVILKRDLTARLAMVTFTRSSTAETLHRLTQEVSMEGIQRCTIQTFAKFMLDHARPLLGKRQLIMGPPHSGFLRRVAAGDEQVYEYLSHQAAVDYLESGGDLEKIPVHAKRYITALHRYAKVDLTTLSVELILALQAGEIEPLNFTHMIVDEFQDTDAIQYAWIKEHLREGRSFTVVGDDDQSIYGFRGALGYSNMVSFQQDFGGMGILLRLCFRCAPEVLEAAARLVEHNSERLDKEMISTKPAGGQVILKSIHENDIVRAMGMEVSTLEQYKRDMVETRKAPANYGSEYRHAIERYLKKVNSRYNGRKNASELYESVSIGFEAHRVVAAEIEKSPEGWAVLARTNMLLDSMQKELASLNIPVTRLGGRSIWEDPAIVGYMALLSAMANPKNFHFLDDALYFLGVEASNIASIHHAAVSSKSINRIPRANNEAAQDKGFKLFFEFNELAPIMDRDSGVIGEFLQLLTERLSEHDDQHDGAMTKYRIVNDVLISGSGTIGMRLASIQRLAQQKGEQDHNNRASVILCTLNGSKGLQWPKVWIIDVEKGRAPARYKGDPEDEEAQDAHLEEERRLVYVGMTRAEQTLVLSYREGKSSIFIDEIRGYEGEE